MNNSKTTKHTSGPWKAARSPRGRFDAMRLGIEAGNQVIAEIVTIDSGEANARLIAAAPELLEIVEAVARFDGRNTGVTARLKEMARAAIAKATGGAS